jgi:hypothetical protein
VNQLQIEEQYARSNIRKKIKEDICPNSPVLKLIVDAISKYRNQTYNYASKARRVEMLIMPSDEIALELLILVLPIKGISPIQAIAAQLGAHLGFDDILDAVKTASEIIAVAEISGAYTLYHAHDYENDLETLGIKPNYTLELATIDYINQTKYLPPMIEKPLPWSNNINGGYLTQHSSVILGNLNHHMDKQAIDVINILQDIPWKLNNILDYQEVPNKDLDTPDKQQQFNDIQIQSTRVYQELLDADNQFHFVWKFDKRGRMYSQGYHCNLQGTEYKKSILSFANEELIQ